MGYKITKKDYKNFIDYALKTGFDDKDFAKEHLHYLIHLFNDLPDPVRLHRIIFLSKKSDFRKDEPGSHYSLDKNKLVDNHYLMDQLNDYAEFNDSKPYILTIESPKSKIDFDETINNNLAYPNEEEITLKEKGKGTNFISLERIR